MNISGITCGFYLPDPWPWPCNLSKRGERLREKASKFEKGCWSILGIFLVQTLTLVPSLGESNDHGLPDVAPAYNSVAHSGPRETSVSVSSQDWYPALVTKILSPSPGERRRKMQAVEPLLSELVPGGLNYRTAMYVISEVISKRLVSELLSFKKYLQAGNLDGRAESILRHVDDLLMDKQFPAYYPLPESDAVKISPESVKKIEAIVSQQFLSRPTSRSQLTRLLEDWVVDFQVSQDPKTLFGKSPPLWLLELGGLQSAKVIAGALSANPVEQVSRSTLRGLMGN